MFAIHCAAEAVNSPKILSGQEKEQDMMVRRGGEGEGVRRGGEGEGGKEVGGDAGCMVAVAL